MQRADHTHLDFLKCTRQHLHHAIWLAHVHGLKVVPEAGLLSTQGFSARGLGAGQACEGLETHQDNDIQREAHARFLHVHRAAADGSQ